MEINLANAQVAHRHLPSVLPILTIGKIAKRQSDKISVFALDRVAQTQHRVIAPRLRDGHVSRAQYARDDRMRLFGSQAVRKLLPVTFARRHDQPPTQGVIGAYAPLPRLNLTSRRTHEQLRHALQTSPTKDKNRRKARDMAESRLILTPCGLQVAKTPPRWRKTFSMPSRLRFSEPVLATTELPDDCSVISQSAAGSSKITRSISQ